MLLVNLVNLYVFALFARIILSYFPLQPGGAMAGIYGFLYTITEPVLGPLRRVIPPVGGFDFSPLVAVFGLQLLARALTGG